MYVPDSLVRKMQTMQRPSEAFGGGQGQWDMETGPQALEETLNNAKTEVCNR